MTVILIYRDGFKTQSEVLHTEIPLSVPPFVFKLHFIHFIFLEKPDGWKSLLFRLIKYRS